MIRSGSNGTQKGLGDAATQEATVCIEGLGAQARRHLKLVSKCAAVQQIGGLRGEEAIGGRPPGGKQELTLWGATVALSSP